MRVSLEGRRVRLRDWQAGDLAPYKYWQKPGHLWQEFDAPYLRDPYQDRSRALADAVKLRLEKEDFDGPRMDLVIADQRTDVLLGFVSSSWEVREANWLCIGIVLFNNQVWGKGMGAEALRLWAGYLFRERPALTRLDMRTWSGNAALIALAGKVGFRQEACFRQALVVKGQLHDGLGFGILRTEFENQSGLTTSIRQT